METLLKRCEKVRQKGWTRAKTASLVGAFALIVLMYLPTYALLKLPNPPHALGGLLRVFNPYGIVPFIVGLISLSVVAFYKEFWVQMIYLLLYLGAILFSVVKVMGMFYMWELLYFAPHLVILAAHLVLWFGFYFLKHPWHRKTEESIL